MLIGYSTPAVVSPQLFSVIRRYLIPVFGGIQRATESTVEAVLDLFQRSFAAQLLKHQKRGADEVLHLTQDHSQTSSHTPHDTRLSRR